MMKFSVNPNEYVGNIKFGQTRDEVRRLLTGFKKEFKKNKYSRNTTDDFGYCHVFYDVENRLNAVEFFEQCNLVYQGENLFEITVDELKKLLPDIREDYGSYISQKYSIGITFDGTRVDTVLIGCKDYYC